jgi:hypothetical protein
VFELADALSNEDVLKVLAEAVKVPIRRKPTGSEYDIDIEWSCDAYTEEGRRVTLQIRLDTPAYAVPPIEATLIVRVNDDTPWGIVVGRSEFVAWLSLVLAD